MRAGSGGDGLLLSSSCVRVESLCQQGCRKVHSTDSIREDEKQTDCIIPESLLIQELKPPAVTKEMQAVPGPVRLGNGDSQDGRGWKFINFPIKMAPAPPAYQALQTRFNHHEQMSVPGGMSIKALKIAGPELCKSTKRKQQVIAMGNCLLLGLEAPIC